MDRYKLPQPEVNQIVYGHEVDMLWRSHNLVGELDGYDTHTWDRLHEQAAREAARFGQLLA